jgi:hypothetical protein
MDPEYLLQDLFHLSRTGSTSQQFCVAIVCLIKSHRGLGKSTLSVSDQSQICNHTVKRSMDGARWAVDKDFSAQERA